MTLVAIKGSMFFGISKKKAPKAHLFVMSLWQDLSALFKALNGETLKKQPRVYQWTASIHCSTMRDSLLFFPWFVSTAPEGWRFFSKFPANATNSLPPEVLKLAVLSHRQAISLVAYGEVSRLIPFNSPVNTLASRRSVPLPFHLP